MGDSGVRSDLASSAPSVFELVAQEAMAGTLHPALKYLITVSSRM